MNEHLAFAPPSTSTSQLGWHREWSVALRSQTGWSQGAVYFDPESAKAELDGTSDRVLVSREVSGWREHIEYEAPTPYDGSMDALVSSIVDEEYSVVRAALERGANIAVSHLEEPGNRIAHRLGCPTLEGILDRNTAWTPELRERLKSDRDFRLSIPTFVTPEAAARISGLKICKTCVPIVGGAINLPVRSLLAQNLRNHHVGQVLCSEGGQSLGTIEEVALRRSVGPADRFVVVEVTVRTDRGSSTFGPQSRVHILRLPNEEALDRRAQKVISAVGAKV